MSSAVFTGLLPDTPSVPPAQATKAAQLKVANIKTDPSWMPRAAALNIACATHADAPAL